MRFLPLFSSFALLLSALVGCSTERPVASGNASATSAAAVTTVYLVRHAEKDTNPTLTDPPLTPEGEQRALTLRDTLGSRNIEALFVTNTARSRATAAPLATALQLTPQVYDKPADLAQRIKKDLGGKSVLVVGHSNTLLPLAKELGTTPDVLTIEDGEYDYLFEVKIPATGAATVTTHQFGVGH